MLSFQVFMEEGVSFLLSNFLVFHISMHFIHPELELKREKHVKDEELRENWKSNLRRQKEYNAVPFHAYERLTLFLSEKIQWFLSNRNAGRGKT